MLSLEIYKTIPITVTKENSFSSITSDGKHFYLCARCHQIIEYNHCFEEIRCIETQRTYTSLCYDHKKDRFYAINRDDYNKIYILDTCFKEMECVQVNINCYVSFRDIDYLHGTLYITSKEFIISVPTDCLNKHEIYLKSECPLLCAAKTPCVLLTAQQTCCCQSIQIYDNYRQLQTTCYLPICAYIIDITYSRDYIYILVSKCGQYFVLIGQVQAHLEDKESGQYCNDIIESVAMIETSLAHVLQVESEKLQKIIATCDNPKKILEANEAVNKTIINITNLEQVLYSKLAAVENINDNHHEKEE